VSRTKEFKLPLVESAWYEFRFVVSRFKKFKQNRSLNVMHADLEW